MDACYPFLPALLRSPFRLRDNLLNSVFGPPQKALLLSGVEYGRRAANNPLEISEFNGKVESHGPRIIARA